MRSRLACSCAVLLAACSSGQGNAPSPDAAADAPSVAHEASTPDAPAPPTRCPQGRAQGYTCVPMLPPPGSCPPSDCWSDQDCQSGLNGRCIGGESCSYDECYSDDGCGPNGTCQCRPSADSVAPNVCVLTSCQSNADCGDAAPCSPSLACDGGAPASFCHTIADTCATDNDCATDAGPVPCVYDAFERRWLCAPGGACP